MDNFKVISDSNNDQSTQLISGKQNHSKVELSSLELVGNLPSKNASASMLSEVTDHFKNTFSNVAKGEASASEYIEVGAIALGTAAVGTLAAGRLMQRSAPLVFGRGESAASTGAALSEQTSAILANGIKIERNSPALDAIVTNGVRIGESSPGAAGSEAAIARPPLRPFDGYKFPPNPEGFKFKSGSVTDVGLRGQVQRFSQWGGEDKMHFNLAGSRVTDEGLTHLLTLKDRLATVNLTGTRVTEDGIRTLRQNLPNAEIIFDKSQAITPLARAIADASLKAPIAAFDRAAYQWVPPREIAEVVFRKPH